MITELRIIKFTGKAGGELKRVDRTKITVKGKRDLDTVAEFFHAESKRALREGNTKKSAKLSAIAKILAHRKQVTFYVNSEAWNRSRPKA